MHALHLSLTITTTCLTQPLLWPLPKSNFNPKTKSVLSNSHSKEVKAGWNVVTFWCPRSKGLKLNLRCKYKSTHTLTLRILQSPETNSNPPVSSFSPSPPSFQLASSERLLFHSSSSSFRPSINLCSFTIPPVVSDLPSIFPSLVSPPDETPFASASRVSGKQRYKVNFSREKFRQKWTRSRLDVKERQFVIWVVWNFTFSPSSDSFFDFFLSAGSIGHTAGLNLCVHENILTVWLWYPPQIYVNTFLSLVLRSLTSHEEGLKVKGHTGL